MLPFFFQAETWQECITLIQQNHWWKWPWSHATANDGIIRQTYRAKDCATVTQQHFSHPSPSDVEINFPIAYVISVYKSAKLLEQLLQAIYMPHNWYCIHADVQSDARFRAAVTELIRCLPNVFLTDNNVDVIYPHISILHAQFNCMKDLLRIDESWKYAINLVGQDFPLYNNYELVQALQGLSGRNNIESFHHPKNLRYRTEYAFEFKPRTQDARNHGTYDHSRTTRKKPPPPDNIRLLKGSNHVALTREFVEYIIFNETARAFIEWLSDTLSPPETFYASLQQHPGTPGGLVGAQPEFIMRAINWYGVNSPDFECQGEWVREICWLAVGDLRWVLGPRMRNQLFVQKIPFDLDKNLLQCLAIARKQRRYGKFLFL